MIRSELNRRHSFPKLQVSQIVNSTEGRAEGMENVGLVHANGPSQLWLLGWNHRRTEAGHPLSLTGSG